MTTADWNSLAERLTKALRPVAAPPAIPFSPARQENIPAFSDDTGHVDSAERPVDRYRE